MDTLNTDLSVPAAQETVELELTLSNEQITTMVKTLFMMQAELNANTNGEKWLTGITKDGKPIDCIICMKKEIDEALDCFDWKHWKDIKKPFDLENFKMEMVDVLHFGLSSLLSTNYAGIIAVDQEAFNNGNANHDYVDIDKRPYSEQIEYLINYTMSIASVADIRANVVSNVDMIEENFLMAHPELVGDEHKELVKEKVMLMLIKHLMVHFVSYEDFAINIVHIFECLRRYYNFTFLDVYRMYVGKNVLNLFRQHNGYKEGTYIKTWHGLEDNIYVHRYLENATIEDMSPFKITSYLDDIYKDVLSEQPNNVAREEA